LIWISPGAATGCRGLCRLGDRNKFNHQICNAVRIPALEQSLRAFDEHCEPPSADRSRRPFQGVGRKQALVDRVGAGDNRQERPALTDKQFQQVAFQHSVGKRLLGEVIEIDEGGVG
jgi:hypothetical protein